MAMSPSKQRPRRNALSIDVSATVPLNATAYRPSPSVPNFMVDGIQSHPQWGYSTDHSPYSSSPSCLAPSCRNEIGCLRQQIEILSEKLRWSELRNNELNQRCTELDQENAVLYSKETVYQQEDKVTNGPIFFQAEVVEKKDGREMEDHPNKDEDGVNTENISIVVESELAAPATKEKIISQIKDADISDIKAIADDISKTCKSWKDEYEQLSKTHELIRSENHQLRIIAENYCAMRAKLWEEAKLGYSTVVTRWKFHEACSRGNFAVDGALFVTGIAGEKEQEVLQIVYGDYGVRLTGGDFENLERLKQSPWELRRLNARGTMARFRTRNRGGDRGAIWRFAGVDTSYDLAKGEEISNSSVDRHIKEVCMNNMVVEMENIAKSLYW
ncbi:uncharacterized protein LY89DRAFT_738006 [Mollisia scopiformis]|uniref:Uncharacterized protein n=1 Tax=Mollisia scopiformis TaxID=149040 RepID=A0A194WZH7_MOLSC|nr:uncharacterized protein LY89DRAFT_738006 [Mollisia scopiformis]KUJ13114.1 hypothetical protein LY89DRAFT_738006 [Mollisia scopiformis]